MPAGPWLPSLGGAAAALPPARPQAAWTGMQARPSADDPDAAEVKVLAQVLVMAVEAAAACFEPAGEGPAVPYFAKAGKRWIEAWLGMAC